MRLDPQLSVGVGLFTFRVIAEVTLFEPEVAEVEDAGPMECSHYFRTFGVTAETFAAASEIVESLNAQSPDEAPEQPDGWLDGIDVALVDPTDLDGTHTLRAPITERGVHFVSGKIYFAGDQGKC